MYKAHNCCNTDLKVHTCPEYNCPEYNYPELKYIPKKSDVEYVYGLFTKYQLGHEPDDIKIPMRLYNLINNKLYSIDISRRHLFIKTAVDVLLIHRYKLCQCKRKNIPMQCVFIITYALYYGIDKTAKYYNDGGKAVYKNLTCIETYNTLLQLRNIKSLRLYIQMNWLFRTDLKY